MTQREAATTVERAYQLARSGECAGVDDIRRRMSREGYLDAIPQLAAPSLRRALSKLCQEAQSRTQPSPPRRGRDHPTS